MGGPNGGYVRAWIGSLGLLAALGCTPDDSDPLAPPPGSLLAEPLAPFPDSLLDIGLYPMAPRLDVTSTVALPYEPQWPLWSSGSDKLRYLVLPRGETIDNSTSEAWRFPAGTLLFKTFAYADEAGQPRPVETRVMRLDAQGEWEFAAYRWNEAGDDALQLPLRLSEPVAVPGQPERMHTIPARIECRQCHEASFDPVLGLTELQLGRTGSTTLAEAGAFAQAPPEQPATIEHDDPLTRDVLGWFHGNCVHCHNGGDAENASFDLRAAVALTNTIGQPTQSSASAAGIRIEPGAPERSVLFLAVSGEGDDPEQEDMPPVGIDVRDTEGVERLRSFIESLNP